MEYHHITKQPSKALDFEIINLDTYTFLCKIIYNSSINHSDLQGKSSFSYNYTDVFWWNWFQAPTLFALQVLL